MFYRCSCSMKLGKKGLREGSLQINERSEWDEMITVRDEAVDGVDTERRCVLILLLGFIACLLIVCLRR